jgi:hypothetical protein
MYYVMTDPKAFREGVGRLLADVQRIKAEGDYQAAKALVETYTACTSIRCCATKWSRASIG